MTRGLVIGKFYPPHRGHGHLIESARRQVDDLVVVVCHRDDQLIHGELRARWLREIHPTCRVMVVPDIGQDDDSSAWARYTRDFLGYVPDAVFTSEDYGDAYAKFLGCRHVLVDRARLAVPVCATQIRQEPAKYWDYLEPCVRAHFAKRVCVLGAESTGTTTLAKALAAHYGTMWVPEFGRTYSEAKSTSRDADRWHTDEFTLIAARQNEFEDALARRCDRILFCDTDSFATRLWHERYMGFLSDEVAAVGAGRRYDAYFLTGDEIPFVQDGLRDGEHIRHAMNARFREELARTGRKFFEMVGTHEERMAQAVKVCDLLLASPFGEARACP